jgi:spore germination protein GerM
MTVKRSIIHLVRIVLAIGGMMTLLVFSEANLTAQERAASNSGAGEDAGRKPDKAVTHLYFADKNNVFLRAEQRVLSQTEEPISYGRNIMEALISGPAQKLAPTIPRKTTLRAIYITEAGTCYVDLSYEIRENHPGGAATELLTVYSIVNSLILNIAEIEAVRILIEGRESITLAGHIDLQQPLRANMLLIR